MLIFSIAAPCSYRFGFSIDALCYICRQFCALAFYKEATRYVAHFYVTFGDSEYPFANIENRDSWCISRSQG